MLATGLSVDGSPVGYLGNWTDLIPNVATFGHIGCLLLVRLGTVWRHLQCWGTDMDAVG